MATSDVGGELKYIITADIEPLNEGIKKASKAVDKFGSEVEKQSAKAGEAIGRRFSDGTLVAMQAVNNLVDVSIAGFARVSSALASISFDAFTTAAGTASAAVTYLANKGIQGADQLSQYNAQVIGLAESTEDANSAMAAAVTFFKQNPFQRFETVEAVKNLMQYDKGIANANTGSAKLTETLDMLGVASLSTGTGISELARQWGEISNVSKVSVGQLDEFAMRVPAIWDAIGKRIGKGAAEVREELLGVGIEGEIVRKAMSDLYGLNTTKLNGSKKEVQEYLATLSGAARQSAEAYLAFGNTMARQTDRVNGRLADMAQAFAGYELTAAGGFKAVEGGLYQSVINLKKMFGDVMASSTETAAKMRQALGKIAGAIVPYVDKLTANLPKILDKVFTLLDKLADHTEMLIPILGGALVMFGRLGAGLPGIGGVIGNISSGFSKLFGVLNPLGRGLPGIVSSFSGLAVILGVIGVIKGGGAVRIFSQLKQVFGELQKVFAKLMPVFEKVVEAMGEALLEIIEALLPSIPPLVEAFGKLAAAFGKAIANLAPGVVKGFAFALETLANVINMIPQPVLELILTTLLGFGLLVKTVSSVRKFVAGLVLVKNTVVDTLNAIRGIPVILGSAIETIKQASAPLQDFAAGVADALGVIPEIAGNAAGAIINAFKTIGGVGLGVIRVIKQVGVALGTSVFGIGKTISAYGLAIVKTVGTIINDTLIAMVKVIGKGVLNYLGEVLQGIVGVFNMIGKGMWKIISPALNFIKNSVIAMTDFLKSAFSKLAELAGQIATTVAGKIKDAFVTMAGVVKKMAVSIANTVKTAFTTLLDIAKKVATAVANAFKTMANTVMEFAKKAADAIKNLASIISNTLANAINVVREKFGLVGGTLKRILGEVKQHIVSFAQSVAKTLQTVGENIVKFLQPALEKIKDFASKASGMIKDLANQIYIMVLQPMVAKFQSIGTKISTHFGNTIEKIKGHFNTANTVASNSASKIGGAFSKIGTSFGKIGEHSNKAKTAVKGIGDSVTNTNQRLTKTGVAGTIAAGGIKATGEASAKAAPQVASISDSMKSLFGTIKTIVTGITDTLNTLVSGLVKVLKTALGGIGEAIKALLSPLSDGNLLKGVGVLAGLAATLVIAAFALRQIGEVNVPWGKLLNNIAQMTVAMLAIGLLAAGVGALMMTGIGAAVLASGLAAVAGISAAIVVAAVAMKVAGEKMPDNPEAAAKKISKGIKALLGIDFGGFFDNLGKAGKAAAASAVAKAVLSIGESLEQIASLRLPATEVIASQLGKIESAYNIIKDTFVDDGGGLFASIGKFLFGGENNDNSAVKIASETTKYIRDLAVGIEEIGKVELPERAIISTQFDKISGIFELIKEEFIDDSGGVMGAIGDWAFGKKDADNDRIRLASEVSSYIKELAVNVAEIAKSEIPDKGTLEPIFNDIDAIGTVIKEKFIDDAGGVWRSIGEFFGGKEDSNADKINLIKDVSATLKEFAKNLETLGKVEIDKSRVETLLGDLESVMNTIKGKFVDGNENFNVSDEVKNSVARIGEIATSLTGIAGTFKEIPELDSGKTNSFLTNVKAVVSNIVNTFTKEIKVDKVSESMKNQVGYVKDIAESMKAIGTAFTDIKQPNAETVKTFLATTGNIIKAIMAMFLGGESPYAENPLEALPVKNFAEADKKIQESISAIENTVNSLKNITEVVATLQTPNEEKVTLFTESVYSILTNILDVFIPDGKGRKALKLSTEDWGANGTIVTSVANIVTVINSLQQISEAVAKTNTSADVTGFNNFVSQLGTMLDTINTNLKNKSADYESIGIDYGTKLVTGLNSKQDDIFKAGEEWQSKVWHGVNSKMGDMFPLGEKLGGKFAEGVKSKYNDVKSSGEHLVNGLISGINTKLGEVKTAAIRLADEANKAFKNRLDINSPSRVFRQNGNWIGIGLAEGLLDQEEDVRSAAEVLAETIREPFDEINKISVNVNGQVGSGVGGNNYNNSTSIIQNNTIKTDIDYSRMMSDLKWELFKA